MTRDLIRVGYAEVCVYAWGCGLDGKLFRGAMFRPGGSMADWWQLMQAPGGGFDFGQPLVGGGGRPDPTGMSPAAVCCELCVHRGACSEQECCTLQSAINEATEAMNGLSTYRAALGVFIALFTAFMTAASMGILTIGAVLTGVLSALIALIVYWTAALLMYELLKSSVSQGCWDCFIDCMRRSGLSDLDDLMLSLLFGAMGALPLTWLGVIGSWLGGSKWTNPFEDWRERAHSW